MAGISTCWSGAIKGGSTARARLDAIMTRATVQSIDLALIVILTFLGSPASKWLSSTNSHLQLIGAGALEYIAYSSKLVEDNSMGTCSSL